MAEPGEKRDEAARSEALEHRRRVLVEPNRDKLAELAVFSEDWARDIPEACEEFSTDELRTVTRLLSVVSERRRAAAARPAG